jgi:3-hydroxyisobutyrate dehydrogenase
MKATCIMYNFNMNSTSIPSAAAQAATPMGHQQPQKVAFIGLGVMGYPMAGHLAKAHHVVTVYNRHTPKAQAWMAEYANNHPLCMLATTPRQAASQADWVFTCVSNDTALREVLLGPDGVFDAMQPGQVVIDHTTASAAIARELHTEAQKRGFHFIDAPVSGGQAGAIQGRLSTMCGGDAQALESARPLLTAYASNITYIGPSGSGQLAKMVNQICIAGLLQGLAEGLAFGEKAGLDMPQVLHAISQGAAQSWQMHQRGPSMLQNQFDFGFAVEWMRKDLNLCLEESQRNGAQLPITAIIDQFYAELQNMGGQRWDTSSLIRRLR